MPHPKPLPPPQTKVLTGPSLTIPPWSSQAGSSSVCPSSTSCLQALWSPVSHCCFCLCGGGGVPAQASNLLCPSRFPLSSLPQALASRMEWNTGLPSPLVSAPAEPGCSAWAGLGCLSFSPTTPWPGHPSLSVTV